MVWMHGVVHVCDQMHDNASKFWEPIMQCPVNEATPPEDIDDETIINWNLYQV